MVRNLPKEITSYDLLKTVAVLLMIADHIGYYFFPDDLWWRVAGRICVPMWFFLIGYAKSRDLGPSIWIWMAVLAISDIIVGQGVFPVNILATMIVIRLVIDPVINRTRNDQSMFWAIFTIIVMLTVPTAYLFEYGSLGVIIAIFGCHVRLYQEKAMRYGRHVNRLDLAKVLLSSMAIFVFIQNYTFQFPPEHLIVFVIGTASVFLLLATFRSLKFKRFSSLSPTPLTFLIQLMGRRTMEIYAIHLIVFNVIVGFFIGHSDFELFDFKWLAIESSE